MKEEMQMEDRIEKDKSPVQVTIVGHRMTRQVVPVVGGSAPTIDALAIGKTCSELVIEFPQTNKGFPPKTFIVEVSEEVLVEYAECSYDLQREAHPELNLPDRAEKQPPIWSKT